MGEHHPLIELLYLGAAVCFIVGIKRLSKPATAANGNLPMLNRPTRRRA